MSVIAENGEMPAPGDLGPAGNAYLKGSIVVTIPSCAGEAGVPTATIPYHRIRPSDEQIFEDALEVLTLRSASYHGPGFLPVEGWTLNRTGDDRYELRR